MIKAVLFDMDGIMMDSEAWYMDGTLAWMRELGYEGSAEAVWPVIGTTMERTYEILYDLMEGKIPVEKLKERNERWFSEEHPLNCAEIMFPGVPEVISGLKKDGYLLACCSSSPRETVYEDLGQMGVLDCFDVILSGDEKFPPKPAGDIYRKACEMLGVSNDECVVYEDSTLGILAGRNAGMYVIARRDDRFLQDQSAADCFAADIYEMNDLLRGGDLCRK